jgi:hypothetical protein
MDGLSSVELFFKALELIFEDATSERQNVARVMGPTKVSSSVGDF